MRDRPPVRTLHIDIEGGWGGSSRSLFELLSRLDPARISAHVALRQFGPAHQWYEDARIPTYHIPEIGSYVPRHEKALKNLIASAPRLLRLRQAAERISEIVRAHDIDLIHLNYEGLFLLAKQIRRLVDVPILVHSRAHLPADRWGRWVVRTLSLHVDQALFISPQEQTRWAQLAGPADIPGEVMWNIARQPLPRSGFGKPPEIVYLGSLDFTKGVDRMLDIAREMKKSAAPALKIAVYGSARTNPVYARKLEERILQEQLGDRIELRGHTIDVASVLSGAFALVRPSRENDPWGRDVIEATAAGVPVLATGDFEGVVVHGVNGFLYNPFDAEAITRRLIELYDNPELWRSLSLRGQRLGLEKFGGQGQTIQFTGIVERLVQHGAERSRRVGRDQAGSAGWLGGRAR